MYYRTIVFLLAVLFFFLIASPAQSAESTGDGVLDAVLSELERKTISDYYRGRYGKNDDDGEYEQQKGKKDKKQKGLPPGLAKRATLPPGLVRQLQRKDHLPPGLEKRDLPSNLDHLLPDRLPGEKRVVVDNDVLLIDETTGIILDIMRDVF